MGEGEAPMGLKSFDRHKESLRDGREVYFDGERVADVTVHPVLGVGMAFAGIDYKLAEDPGHRDLAGGLLVTAPFRKDWENEATRRYLDYYLGGVEGVSGERRTRAMKLIRDIAASGFGGYQEILSIHAEGSLAAQRITILRDYDVKRCVEIVKSYLKD